MGGSAFDMSDALYRKLHPVVRLDASRVRLRSSYEELTPAQSKAQVHVSYDDKEALLPMFLDHRSSPTLLGNTWIHALCVRLPQRELAEVHSLEGIQELISDYATLFEPGLGTFNGNSTRFHVPADAVSKFCKPRPLRFALLYNITQKLQFLE